METRTHRRAVLATGVRLAYAAPILAMTMIVGTQSTQASAGGADWPNNFHEILCGCRGPEWQWIQPGGDCWRSPWAYVLEHGTCGYCAMCSPTQCVGETSLHSGLLAWCTDESADDNTCPYITQEQWLPVASISI